MGDPSPRALPRKRVGSGALIRDADGRILVVKPSYKDGWEIPGGVVEVDESPLAACEREVVEELGLAVPISRLLVVDWLPLAVSRSGHDGVLFVFDGGTLEAAQFDEIRLQPDELTEWRVIEPRDLHEYFRGGMARRLQQALDAADAGETRYLEWGDDPTPSRHDLRIRRARPGDVPAMATLGLRSRTAGYGHIFPPEAGPPPSEAELAAQWREVMGDPRRHVLVAEQGGRIVGNVGAEPAADDPRLGWISGLYVDPEVWGEGIGASLYEAAVDVLRRAGHTRAGLWVLEKNERARSMYERRGWQLVPGVTKPLWEHIVDVRYERDL